MKTSLRIRRWLQECSARRSYRRTTEIDQAIERIRATAEEAINRLLAQKEEESEFPRLGDRYFALDSTGCVVTDTYDGSPFRRTSGNMYRTEADALRAIDVLNVVEELNDQPGRCGLDGISRCFGVKLGVREKTHVAINNSIYESWRGIYYMNQEQCDAAIKAVGEERILKAMQFDVRWPR